MHILPFTPARTETLGRTPTIRPWRDCCRRWSNGDEGRRAGEPALIDRHGATSWGELDERVNRLVHVLRSLGVQPGERVAILSGNRREVYEVIQAVAHSGVLLVPINWHFAAEEVQYVVENSGRRRCSSTRPTRLPQRASSCRGSTSSTTTPAARRATKPRSRGAAADEPDDQQMGGVMFYTSGTTGRPKGVRNTAFAGGVPPEVYELMAAGMVNIGFPPNGRTLLCGPHYHSAQWAFSFFPMIGGSSIVLQERFVPEETLRLIDEHAITNVHLVPTQFVRLLRADEAAKAAFRGESLQLVLHGAAPCSPQVKRQMIEWWGPKVTEYYGATEGGVVSIISADEWLRKPGSVGKPMSNYVVRIQAEDDEGACGRRRRSRRRSCRARSTSATRWAPTSSTSASPTRPRTPTGSRACSRSATSATSTTTATCS
jgi:long-chain acyl-CoA synthetase